jgi:hypothetical protein
MSERPPLKGHARLVKAGASALARTAQDRGLVAGRLAETETRRKLNQVVRPNSISTNLRKAGVAVLLSPDPLGPVADVPGIVMLGASYAMRRREPESVKSVFNETRKVLQELQAIL